MTRRYLVAGLVQGVGFRWYVARHARGLGLAGFARNLPDGRVEVVATGGDPAALGRLEELLRAGPAHARVDEVDAQDQADDPQIPRGASISDDDRHPAGAPPAGDAPAHPQLPEAGHHLPGHHPGAPGWPAVPRRDRGDGRPLPRTGHDPRRRNRGPRIHPRRGRRRQPRSGVRAGPEARQAALGAGEPRRTTWNTGRTPWSATGTVCPRPRGS